MATIEVPRTAAGRGYRGRLGRWCMAILVVLILGSAFWTWLTLSWAYAEGERAGVLQKFVRRGWICKTSEGEIALYYGGGQYMGAGTSPQLWDFSVRDKTVAASLSQAVGHRVQLHYTEHPGIPTACFAETRFFVDRVTVTDDDTKPASGGAQPATGPQPAAGVQSPAGVAPGVSTPTAPADARPQGTTDSQPSSAPPTAP